MMGHHRRTRMPREETLMVGRAYRKKLSAAEAIEMKERYYEVNEKGRRFRSVAEIAEAFGVGESTAWRAINSSGPYRHVPEPDTVTDTELAASAARLVERMAQEASGEAEMHPDKLLDALPGLSYDPEALAKARILKGE